MKKRFLILMGILLIAIFLLPLFACEKKVKIGTVDRIEIMQGSFKAYYELDEIPDFKKAKMRIFSKEGLSDTISITKDMVSGLDTRTNVPTIKELTVEYKGCTDTFKYSVGGTPGITSEARVKIAQIQTEEGKDIVQVFLAGTSYVKTGIYALSFVVTKSSDLILKKSWSVAQKYNDNSWHTEELEEDDEIRIIFYSETGMDKIQSSQDILIYEMEIGKPLEQMFIGIKDVTLSDGKKDTKAPSITVTISPK